ncbi:cytochrome c3 family protein [Desulfuromonas acetoxidans]|uniref:Doubled CXXCH motif domain-containing protein n=1 Tax=Desulfuromonas acetoxidans (strain DSM 684 / 11070) TaxID=281689 RepID=Q1K1I0_DESA6|nr:cytochrome c3 family protein [Desulfuromonas acetoxidans]EAT16408.1 hypothetical protein Dace_1872 [Desulfuromonas acetoxidans DSM 684]MBF0644352.1 cytochrome c3 family protein [Desulfuromonas acetoxidans]NVD23547.1 cytochrome c3 family protein [Desulfuromonas acetoxidans]NVE16068.1 cytochrome c3 family protein [Desulfuromonas acetoxidans]
MKTSRLGLLLIVTLVLWSSSALASVSGSCANCHTMHATDGAGNTLAGGAKGSLTIGGCVGCHTGNNEDADGASAGAGGVPYVMDTAEPTYGPEYSGGTLVANVQTLAGGSFWWVGKSAGNDATTGHNVTTDGLCDFDMDAPGRRDGDQTAFSSGAPLTCAGTMGCHGDRSVAGDYASISGAHHGSSSTTVDDSFRFLDGIAGTEAPDWEYAAAIDNHNSYKAQARSEASTMSDGGDTISSLCGQCHGDFHSGTDTVSDGSAWLRHPTDIVLPAGEYASYASIPDESGIYNIIAPVGVATPIASTADVTLANSVVTCISCHRAHGSPYADLLRWDYANISAGSPIGGVDNNGCFACHTSKDG